MRVYDAAIGILHISMTMPKPRLCASSIAANFVLGNNLLMTNPHLMGEIGNGTLHTA